MKIWKALLPGLAVLLAALAVRLPALTAGLPYMNYVDEGHVLHHVSYLLDRRTWEPDTYSYPTLPFYLVAGAAQAWSPVYAATHGHALRDDLSPAPPEHYDLLEPPDLIVIGPPGHPGVLPGDRPARRASWSGGSPVPKQASSRPGSRPSSRRLVCAAPSSTSTRWPSSSPSPRSLRRAGPCRRGPRGATLFWPDDGRPRGGLQVSGGPGLPSRRPVRPPRSGGLAGEAAPAAPGGRRGDHDGR